ncbi:MAG: hypothetical protein QXI37_02465, partial [Thermoprotei archaeon]
SAVIDSNVLDLLFGLLSGSSILELSERRIDRDTPVSELERDGEKPFAVYSHGDYRLIDSSGAKAGDVVFSIRQKKGHP